MHQNQALLIRTAELSDRVAILATVRAAFAGPGHNEQEEIDIVETIWSRHAQVEGVELVAIRNGEVIGHVLGSWGDLAGTSVAGIAPLAVHPAHQRSGVGTALMIQIIRVGMSADLPFFVLLGEPGYYERFGFEPAERFGVWYQPAGRDNPHFMLRPLRAFSGEVQGQYRYAWEL
jgi:putative acetyltransferase